MKRKSFILLGCLTVLPGIPAVGAPVCLRQQDITGINSPDGKTLMVKMRDGKLWVNELKTRCPGLRFNGFTWVLHQPALVCENSQSLRVIDSGEVCTLGKFTLQTAP